MERIVLALGVRGLVNAQFIVRDDGVYLIEVNPRASRTVPFLSKVTGVPMVELAVRIALGETLRGDGLAGRPAARPGPRRGQGAGVLDGEAARGGPVGRARDAVDRRGHRDPPRSPGGAGQGAPRAPRSSRPGPGPEGALALLSIADRDKALLGRLADGLARAGYRFAATDGTAAGPGRAGPRRAARREVRDRAGTRRSGATAAHPRPHRRPARSAWS